MNRISVRGRGRGRSRSRGRGKANWGSNLGRDFGTEVKNRRLTLRVMEIDCTTENSEEEAEKDNEVERLFLQDLSEWLQ